MPNAFLQAVRPGTNQKTRRASSYLSGIGPGVVVVRTLMRMASENPATRLSARGSCRGSLGLIAKRNFELTYFFNFRLYKDVSESGRACSSRLIKQNTSHPRRRASHHPLRHLIRRKVGKIYGLFDNNKSNITPFLGPNR